ncbi:MAG TPA: protein-glutamate O-methyltransferase CheR [Vicinamibacterales bacterium]|nr:protein-glutamate O-methyltransferase CheR [Vicinamibacterales bacterium]
MPAADNELELGEPELQRLSRLLYDASGITLHDGKGPLVIARLRKRLTDQGYRSFAEYLDAVERDRTGAALTGLVDAMATNHTSFFREPQHFAYLQSSILPQVRARRVPVPLKVWSMPCSTGEEPYSLAVSLLDAGLPAGFTILASDLSTKALRRARDGVYRQQTVAGLPKTVLRRHFERGTGAEEGLVRVSASVRRHVAFRRLNLIDLADLGHRFDVIFCRNLLIYFDQAAQQRSIASLERHLAPGGHLFISHSESLNAVRHSLQWVAAGVYRST